MPYGQRGTRYYSRRGGTGGIAPFFSPSTRAGSRSGLGPGRFIHSCEKYACRVSRTVQHAARTQVDLNNPASRSSEHARGAADA